MKCSRCKMAFMFQTLYKDGDNYICKRCIEWNRHKSVSGDTFICL